MSGGQLTRHAEVRMAQRGIREEDLDIIRRIATEVEGGYFVRNKDAAAEIRRLQREIDRVRRINGTRLVLTGDQVLTAYHALPSKTRRLMRQRQ